MLSINQFILSYLLLHFIQIAKHFDTYKRDIDDIIVRYNNIV